MTTPVSAHAMAIGLRRIGYVACFGLALSTAARANVVSTFDSGTLGWSVVSFTNLTTGDYSVFSVTAPNFTASGGHPGGFISTTDPDNGDFTFSAPSDFLGSHAGATHLSWDLSHVGAVDYQPSDVLITGGGLRLVWKSNPDIVPAAAFQTFSVSFAPSAGWTVGSPGGPLATTTDFQTVLGGITGLFIRGEYTIGLSETAGLDNVTLAETSALPEPTSLALLGVGLCGAGLLRRRRI